MAKATYVYEGTVDNFEERVLSKTHRVPVVVDFWAPWCGPCQQLNPVIEALAEELGDTAKIGKVNVDDNRDLAVKLSYSLPCTLISEIKH